MNQRKDPKDKESVDGSVCWCASADGYEGWRNDDSSASYSLCLHSSLVVSLHKPATQKGIGSRDRIQIF
jgi:hypothetical protein